MKLVSLPNQQQVYAFSKTDADVVYHEIFAEENYLKHGIEVKDGDCIIDAGANIGLFSLYLAGKFHNLTLHLFEPVADIVDVLTKNAQQFLASQAYTIVQQGLSNKKTAVAVTFCPYLSVMTGMYTNELNKYNQKAALLDWLMAMIEDYQRIQASPKKSLRVIKQLLTVRFLKNIVAFLLLIPLFFFLLYLKIITRIVQCQLDKVSAYISAQNIETIHLFKIDVEGAEWDVLMGIEEDHWPKIKQLIIEVHDINERVTNIRTLLEKQHYKVTVD